LITTKKNNYTISSDTIFLDSLSIFTESVKLFDNSGNPLNIDFDIDFEKSSIIFKEKPNLENITISYKTFPINFFQSKSFMKKEDFLISDRDAISKRYQDYYSSANSNMYNSNLESKGSIFRGINFGNNQNAVVNSGMNLQLEGKIAPNLNVTAAITDNNIPIQPDGSSQQLQEFDKMFIRLYNDKISITAADFELQKPTGYFLNYNKKVQGLEFSIKDRFDNKKNKEIAYQASISGAIAKGKFKRQEIKGIEGNQGPYKLIGENNETYIIVLAGTERVYIDGILQKRGYDNDYIIDYNLGEVSFSASKPINKDKRIIIEFEYSDKNYTRYLVTTSNTLNFKKSKVWFNFYNESDNKNQPFEQDLKDSERQMLKEIGDNIDMALAPSYTYNEQFEKNQIRYQIIDTVVNGIVYDSIFVYSTNPDNAFYTVGFAFVGANKGDYKKSVTTANGKVFEWVAPQGEINQGEYIPYKKIITPKKKQMLTFGGESEITEKTKVNFEFAWSRNDLNTFSKEDSNDDSGFAIKSGIEQDFIKNEKNHFGSKLNYILVTKNFEQIENFRSSEFNRDWNLESIYSKNNNEHIINGEVFYANKYFNTNYFINFLDRNKEYRGLQNALKFTGETKNWKFSGNGIFLNSKDELNTSNFFIHNISISKDIKYFSFQIKEFGENNKWKLLKNDSLAVNSYVFNQYEANISTNDTLKYKFSVNYKFRQDKLPFENILKNSTNSHDFSFFTEINPNNNHKLSSTVTYRKLNVQDTTLYSEKSENNLVGKIEYYFKLFKGLFSSSTFYQIGSGLERKVEFSYIEVAPGQGVYTWIDYNSNSVQEIDEFEIAQYNDQATYIRVISPSSEFVKTYSNQLNQTLNLNPQIIWRDKKGILKILALFSDQFVFSVSQKNTSDKIWEYANPFYIENNESKLVNLNSSIRNSFAFKRNDPKFGIDYVFLSNKNKILLLQGIDENTNLSNTILVRYNINFKFGLQEKFTIGNKTYSSEFFQGKNYKLDNKINEFQLNYQPNLSNRISIKYNYKNKNNKIGEEKLNCHDIGTEYRLSSVTKGALNVTFNYIYYKFAGESNSSIGYEMLEGLQVGKNFTWSISFQRQLVNGLVLDLGYNARKSEDSKIVHIANVQLRAFF
jgi:hypothetical protein